VSDDGAPATAQIEPWLREILRCPSCRAELRDEAGPQGPELVCTNSGCGLAYRVDDGIPVMLIDEARPTNQTPKA
jgi:uncharacterized protein